MEDILAEKKRLIVGAAKPWEVFKLLRILDSKKARYDIFTVEQYRSFFDNRQVYTFGIKSPYDLGGAIKAIKTFYKKYDEVIIVNIFPYNLIYRMIVLLSLFFSKKDIFLWFRGEIKKESPAKQLFVLALSPLSILLIPLSLLTVLVVFIYFRIQDVR